MSFENLDQYISISMNNEVAGHVRTHDKTVFGNSTIKSQE